MEPSNKRRRLAPKAGDQLNSEAAQVNHKPVPPVQDAAPPPERTDFESFARHLQDAAMLIYAQANRSPYSTVSVLLLRWEDDPNHEQDLLALEGVFRNRFNYHTESWAIPTGGNPFSKLAAQMAQHIQYARPDHLLIVYYAGHGFVGSDHNLYWACNAREDASRLKWDGVRCLLEDAQSDILLLLDTCAVADAPTAGSHGIKQAIAAYSPEQTSREPGSRSFTQNLCDSLTSLGSGRPFSIQRLHEEIISQKHNKSLQNGLLSNGNAEPGSGSERMPVCFSLTPGSLQSISLSPTGQQGAGRSHISPAPSDQDMHTPLPTIEDHGFKLNTNADLTFEEPRALVCTTFLGEPSHDMASFKQWLHNTPVAASKIAVEGMFHGPPTVLLVSMPIAVWNVVAADRTCAFLGYVNSHNMTNEYQHLVGGISPAEKVSSFNEQDGEQNLLQAPTGTPTMTRNDTLHQDLLHHTLNGEELLSPNSMPQVNYPNIPSSMPEQKHEVEDSVEMHEAAEQLKALSHVRHLSHENQNDRNHSLIPSDSQAFPDVHDHSMDLQEHLDIVDEVDQYPDFAQQPPTGKKGSRKSGTKSTPKQDTRCTMCSHAPFKDSSSLRKHIAAAHTRPFPCAFAFAGCTSTFGSKNEWKRHIASQHLCLTFYRCSQCPQTTAEGKGNEFNRKDLFTQHLRRMHAPFQIKKSLKGNEKMVQEWEAHVKEMQNSCLVTRRQPPQRSSCPRPECSNVFEGTGSWDDWTEHVGRHMEKGEASRLGVDQLLAQWAEDEGIVERIDNGGYRLVGTEREAGGGGYYDDGSGQGRQNQRVAAAVVPAMQDPLIDDELKRLSEGMLMEG